ncbi:MULTISPECIES: acyl-CoA dehydrogenase [unclassified Sphingomonas]|uniref:acyl-CoA dehydrogenase n=1 Tax=unclassified Sphingomonas TaxID=196159 RepID=UPI0006F1F182|nr:MULTISPECIES: acyl-CoA dehydrogenase [unclassified Sphingomonas]KQX22793.1 acyl-CoA dehydrogenase [Sphingomonas sp. Root1294]KQY67727.1 acyl-CoA dehydrogenase [Sphingomonas sp. Root50]KRB88670.1 acyl-CoA dehydrogenase [Sphingomonas sp. Root720]
MALTTVRRDLVSRPLFDLAGKAMPPLSPTESEAIDAGDAWLDATIFTGDPDWSQLLAVPPARLSAEERAFLDGPVETFCAMIDDWKISWESRDLPPEAWDFLKREGFFGMIIPKRHGGLGFSAYGHSEVVRKIASRSAAAAVTAMVPNSLGPGELILSFGTDEQRDHWLPRLADGREIPCFGLTSADAGSDAAAMTDEGVVCRGQWDGRDVLGIRLSWSKRYITLAPVATVLGLAFKLRDPDHLLGDEEEIGITVALVPTDLPGVTIGRRHLPSMQPFQNGPTSGEDVFVPIDHVIGGAERVGQGWKMLMSALAAGRGISLPSLSAASAAFAAHTTGAYARIRAQFGLPIGQFEGIQERLARVAGNAYLLDGARRLTCAGLDQGHHPAVIASIMKLHATERMRIVVNDAMDVHGGKAIIEGPRNYLASLYRAVPVGITVEGANILTRSLMVFGQGAIRAHPYLLDEIRALGNPDPQQALVQFDDKFWRHVGHFVRTALRASFRSWTGGLFAPAPRGTGRARRFYRQLSRYSAAFALTSDIAFLTLGGELKRRELLSARLGDILSELYLAAAALKRWQDEGRQAADWPLLHYCMETSFQTIEQRFDEILANLPYPPVRRMLRFFIMPFGRRRRGPSDRLIRQVAGLLLKPSATRDRLTDGIYIGSDEEPVGQLGRAFRLVNEVQPIHDRLRKAGHKDWRKARLEGLVDDRQAAALAAAEAAVATVIAVDDFAPEELAHRRGDPAYREAAE